MSLYLVAFDTANTDPIVAHDAITSHHECEWWHFMAGVYLITCKDPLPVVHQDLISKWPGGPLLVAPFCKSTDGYRPDGALPQEAWTWINSHL